MSFSSFSSFSSSSSSSSSSSLSHSFGDKEVANCLLDLTLDSRNSGALDDANDANGADDANDDDDSLDFYDVDSRDATVSLT